MNTHLTGDERPRIARGVLKLRDAAEYLSPITVRRLIARGLIKPNRSLRRVSIAKVELDRFASQ
jgi:hypothetical protein